MPGTPCLDGHEFSLDGFKCIRELVPLCSQIASKCLCLTKLGTILDREHTDTNRPTGTKLVTKIDTIVCCVQDNIQDWKLGLLQDAAFARHLQDSKSTSGGVLSPHWDHIHICSNFLDVQKTNSTFSQQCRIRYDVVGRRCETGQHCKLWDCVL